MLFPPVLVLPVGVAIHRQVVELLRCDVALLGAWLALVLLLPMISVWRRVSIELGVPDLFEAKRFEYHGDGWLSTSDQPGQNAVALLNAEGQAVDEPCRLVVTVLGLWWVDESKMRLLVELVDHVWVE